MQLKRLPKTTDIIIFDTPFLCYSTYNFTQCRIMILTNTWEKMMYRLIIQRTT